MFESMEGSWVVGSRIHMSIFTMITLALWAAVLSFWWIVTGLITHKVVTGLLLFPPFGTLAAIVATPMYVILVSLGWVWLVSAMGLPGGKRTIVDH